MPPCRRQAPTGVGRRRRGEDSSGFNLCRCTLLFAGALSGPPSAAPLTGNKLLREHPLSQADLILIIEERTTNPHILVTLHGVSDAQHPETAALSSLSALP